jgi:hypothetical protein
MHESPVRRGFQAIRTPAFHVGNTGSNPVGDAMKALEGIRAQAIGSKRFHGTSLISYKFG